MKFSATVPVLAAVGAASAQSCPPFGSQNADGMTSCDPSQTYPNGQVCVLMGNCYYLEGTGGLPIPSTTGSAAATGTPAACPAPGTTNASGTSCNPATQYPQGQLCVLKAGCYYLEGTGLVSISVSSAVPTPTACPSPGSTSAAGTSCNPGQQYPNGQLCVLKGGCYYLVGTGLLTTGTVPAGTSATAAPVPTKIVTAGAAHQTAIGGLAAAIGLVAAML